jgi:hypothetical protein
MGNSNNLHHAEHNEEACKYLRKKPDYLDWVVTTAFYASLHYLRHKMLPVTMEGNNGKLIYTEFESFFNACKSPSQGRHGFQQEKVNELFPEISSAYSHLKDICFTARYVNYKCDRELSELAYRRLLAIKEFCTKKA